jgi:hypothetical protein
MNEPSVKQDPGQMPSHFINSAFVTCHGDQGVVRVTLQEQISGGVLQIGCFTMTVAAAEAFARQIMTSIEMSRGKMAKRREGAN